MVDDDEFFDSVAVGSVPIIYQSENTNENAKIFLNECIEGKNVEYERYLGSSVEWKDWKFMVPIKLVVMNKGKRGEKIVKSEINLIYAALLKQNIELVKYITAKISIGDIDPGMRWKLNEFTLYIFSR